MLAQNFLSHDILGISEIERDALVKVLGMLERGEINQRSLDMANFLDEEDCGTVACICGWAHVVSGCKAFHELKSREAMPLMILRPKNLRMLFMVYKDFGEIHRESTLALQRTVGSIIPDEAAAALRSYLTTGEANWVESLTASENSNAVFA